MSLTSSNTPPHFKSTSELARGDYVMQPGENVLLSVEDVPLRLPAEGPGEPGSSCRPRPVGSGQAGS